MPRNKRETLSRLTTPMWPAIAAGVALGGVIGSLSYPVDAGSQATALIRVYQPVDPDQILTAAASTSDTQQSYLSGEIAYLSSPGFREAVAKEVRASRAPEITATQDAQSSIISISAMQPDGAAAQRVVDAALNVYSEHARQQSRQRGDDAVNAINDVIAHLQAPPTPNPNQDQTDQSGDESSSDLGTSDTSTPVLSQDVQTRIQQLDLQRVAIDVQSRRSAPVQVVQAPTVDAESGAPGWSLGAVAGGLLGGLAAMIAIVAWRRRLGVITSAADLETEVEQVLRPVLGLSGLTESDRSYLPLARDIYAQLPSPRSGRILVIGASIDSGTDAVARLVGAGVSEHALTQIVDLSEGFRNTFAQRSRTDLEEALTVVIDGGSIATTPALPDAVKESTQIIVVARFGRDVHDSVRVIAQLARRSGVPITAICTRRGLRLGKSRAARHRFADSPHETADLTV
jgi:hypothetical protein